MAKKEIEDCIRKNVPPKGSPELKGRGTYMKKRAEAMKKCKTSEVKAKKQTVSKKAEEGIAKWQETGVPLKYEEEQRRKEIRETVQSQLDKEAKKKHDETVLESMIFKLEKVKPSIEEMEAVISDLKRSPATFNTFLKNKHEYVDEYISKYVKAEDDRKARDLIESINSDYSELLDEHFKVEDPVSLGAEINKKINELRKISSDEKLERLRDLSFPVAMMVKKVKEIGKLTKEEADALKSDDPRAAEYNRFVERLMASMDW